MKYDFYEEPVDLGDIGLYFIMMDIIEEAMISALPNDGRDALPRDYSLADFCNKAEIMPLPLYVNRVADPSSREYALPVFYSKADAEMAKTTFVRDLSPDPDLCDWTASDWTIFGVADPDVQLGYLECYRKMISLVLLNPFGGPGEYVRCVHIDYLIELVTMEIELCDGC